MMMRFLLCIGFSFAWNTKFPSFLRTRLSSPDFKGLSSLGMSVSFEPVNREIDSFKQKTILTPSKNGVPLTLFVVDCSSPGSRHRIEAVQGAVMGVLTDRTERGHVSVVSCYQNDAEIILEPTNSMTKANRRLANMRKSVMGNLSRGITVALEQAEQSLLEGVANEIIMVIISHTKAHGLLAVSQTGCRTSAQSYTCDESLADSAKSLAERASELNKQGIPFTTIVVDTNQDKLFVEDTVDEGAILATLCNAKYFHDTDLNDEDIIRFIADARSTQQ